jgi:hypothetical protein
VLSGWRSAAALAEVGVDRLAVVICHRGEHLLPVLELDDVTERAGLQRRADARLGERGLQRRVLLDLAGDLKHLAGQLVTRYDVGDEAVRQRLGGVETPGGVHQLGRPSGAGDPREQPGDPQVTGAHAGPQERGGENRPFRRDPDVAGRGVREAGAGAGTVDRGDDRDRQAVQPGDHLADLLLADEQAASGAHACQPLLVAVPVQVEARAEGTAGAGEHDNARTSVLLDLVHDREEVADQCPVEGVEGLGTVEGDLQDAVVNDFQPDSAH